jgi:threonyl-tRNA synthetase
MKKIPYMIIVGEKEKKEEKISIRKRGKINKGLMNLKTFINLFNSEL